MDVRNVAAIHDFVHRHGFERLHDVEVSYDDDVVISL